MMKYPKLKPQERRNQKYSEKQIMKIRKEFDSGKSYWKISQEMKISYTTVRRYLDSKFKEKVNNYQNNYYKDKYHNDPEFKKYLNDTRTKNERLQRHANP